MVYAYNIYEKRANNDKVYNNDRVVSSMASLGLVLSRLYLTLSNSAHIRCPILTNSPLFQTK